MFLGWPLYHQVKQHASVHTPLVMFSLTEDRVMVGWPVPQAWKYDIVLGTWHSRVPASRGHLEISQYITLDLQASNTSFPERNVYFGRWALWHCTLQRSNLQVQPKAGNPKIPLQEHLALIKAGLTESFHTAHLQIRSEKRMHPEGNFCKLSWFSASMQFLLWTKQFAIQAKKSRVNISNWKKHPFLCAKKAKQSQVFFFFPSSPESSCNVNRRSLNQGERSCSKPTVVLDSTPFFCAEDPPSSKKRDFEWLMFWKAELNLELFFRKVFQTPIQRFSLEIRLFVPKPVTNRGLGAAKFPFVFMDCTFHLKIKYTTAIPCPRIVCPLL